ncbi:hypothetical protein CIW83_03095 [Tissierella sp. P1]|uniref:hypothetical protein n=1 Tax=Tissierella sp. P1 TaxID=1280483 RepID=UPI000BA0C203|nr:hypothetical protein [Tissierella sp. P1]OZV13547.1 hypothetical protein CIW83_03095 [Tissierella sp. P1]
MNNSIVDKVLIIDDNYDEALPVIQALSKNGIFTIYWNGNVDTKPEHPLKGIRLVILDMRFSAVTDSHTINANLFTLLKYSISKENGPYILFIWSKHDNEYLESFKNELSKLTDIPQPYLIVNMEKNKYIKVTAEENKYYQEIATELNSKISKKIKDEVLSILQNLGMYNTIDTIQIKENAVEELILDIDEKLKEANALCILLMWENIAKTSAHKLVTNIANVSEIDGTWDNNIKTLIQHLASANAGQSLEPTAKEYIINAMYSLNLMLPDELSNHLMKINIDESRFSFINSPAIMKNIEGDIFSISKPNKKFIVKRNDAECQIFGSFSAIKEEPYKRICQELYSEYLGYLGTSNFKFLCERAASNDLKKPGSIYKVEDGEMLEELSKFMFKNVKDIDINNFSLINLDISSSCDYAQNKLKKVRLLFGIMIENPYYFEINNTDDIYCTPEINVDGKIVKIAFNFHYITYESKDRIPEANKLFSFRELFLTEIKHKLSTYISRVGIINL